MADDIKPAQAKPAPPAPAVRYDLSRRDQFALHFGAAILSNKTGTPTSVAKTTVAFTDAFLAELDKPVQA